MFVSRNAAKRLTRIASQFSRNRSLHLITSAKRVESVSKSAVSPLYRSRTFRTTTMSIENITQSLAALSIKPQAVVSHGATNSPATWREALEANSSVPKSFETIKTLVYKPKTAKTATPVPLVIIARENTDVVSGAVGKKLGLKDLRLASEDLLTEFFSLDKNSRTSCTSCQ